jgi:YD repeat-containing protein
MYVVSVLCITSTTMAQINTDLRPQVKSPEVNKFEQYMNMPVNLVSGTPQVSIPIYTLEYGGMTLPISLEYDASGVKVESIASSVGQNWSLNVGGVVSRIVKGAPDEGGYITNGVNTELNIKGFYRDFGLTKLDNALGSATTYGKFIGWLQESAKGKQDAQPDLFYFSTPHGGAKFVFNNKRQIVYLENTDFIVKEDFMPDFFRSWSAIAPNGIKYKFGLTSATSNANNAVEQNFTNQGKNDGVNSNNFTANAWFLTEISNPTTTNTITIDYTSNDFSNNILNRPTKTSFCYTNITSINNNLCGDEKTRYYDLALNPYGAASDFFGTSTPYTMLNHTSSKVISTITAGTISIYFDYSNRDDLSLNFESHTAKKLDRIRVVESGKCIKTFDFTYSYSLCNDIKPAGITTSENADSKRLMLDKLSESSCDGAVSKPYTFVYNSGTMPYKLSFAQDKFGFYNGQTSNQSLFAKYDATDKQNLNNNRDSNFSLAKIGSLQKIIYPTKGSVNFEFEPHVSDSPVGYVSQDATIWLTGNVTPVAPVNGNNGYNSQTFTINPNDGTNLKIKMYLSRGSSGYASPASGCPTSNYSNAIEIVNSLNNVIYSINYGQLDPLISGHQNQFVMKESEEFLDASKFLPGQTYTIKVYGMKDCFNVSTSIFIPKTIQVPYYEMGGLRIKKITYQNDDSTTLKEVSYTYSNAKSVVQPSLTTRATFDFMSETNFFALSNQTDANKLTGAELGVTDFYKKIQKICPLNAESLTRSIIGNMIQSNNAYSKGFFQHASLGSSPFDINFMGPQISYGKVEQTDGNGKTVNYFNGYKSYSELDFNSFISNFSPAPPVFQSLLAGEKRKIELYDKGNALLKNEMFTHNYSTASTSIDALAIYSDGNMPLFKVYTLQGQTKTLKSESETSLLKGQNVTLTKDYEYTGVNHYQPTKITITNSSGEQIISKMYYPNDLISEPFMQELVNQNRKANQVRTENYNGTVKLSEQKISYAKDATTSNLVLPKSSYGAKFPNSFPTITNIGNLEKKLTYDSYDSSGNLNQYTPENRIPVTLIWGYNKTLPIAKFENATTAQVMSALGVSNLSAVNEANLEAINALRQGLTNIRVTTYTHIPLMGVSSMTDPKGQTIFYNYDGLGRLQNVKDAQGNTLGENQYHYKNQSNQSLF